MLSFNMDDFKFYGISFAGFFQYVTQMVNPFLSFVLLVLTILYTYEKYKSIKEENDE
jgi:hypothetical protein